MKKLHEYRKNVEIFLQGDGGARFFNFAYSIGAAIVIWGALFKILHLPGGNLLLAIGMGTEVLMFILNAFDRPARQPNWERIFPQLGASSVPAVSDADAESVSGAQEGSFSGTSTGSFSGTVGGGNGGGVVVVNGGGYTAPLQAGASENPVVPLELPSNPLPVESMTAAADKYVEQMDNIVEELATLKAETERMSRNIATLNAIYAGMIQAMSVTQPVAQAKPAASASTSAPE